MRVIVNVAFGSHHYARAQHRLKCYLREHTTDDVKRMFWTDQVPKGCPSHKRVTYAFKGAAMAEAANAGGTTLLWLDAVMMPIRNLEPAFKHIEEHGALTWYHPPGEWTVGSWTSDACLAHYEISREDAFKIPMLCSGVFGYSLTHPVGRQMHEQFCTAPAVALHGAWSNKKGEVSPDKRVEGHRHDQSVLSIIAHRLGVKPAPYTSFPSYETDQTVFVHRPRWEQGRTGDYVI